ncbi:amyloid fiber anchoring/assembly protein TapA [Bacillus suaedaesalsae]|uniref:Amyloid fiber anchoring/assembly protein TapA n=1 Tax=Bacillus suaedaesalsae TaxID=2810349 RepID=A0ABS2DKP4_9BACI|nr:amyloid fiber anchoring/assembly protein TapA [Bacillus suaedaesalsae]MBM6619060.1 amyloid fiber anchoring/assembly protein TapA [Bacillus suaedaesalsae]
MKIKFSNFFPSFLHKKARSLLGRGEGGILIRYTRMRRFRRKGKKLLILFRVLAIWYVSILTLSYATSDTGAYFNDIERIKNHLHVSWDPGAPPDNDEWDKSSLSFDSSVVEVNGCEVMTTIFNSGETMSFSTWKYYLYKVDNNGIQIGEPVATGNVPNISEKSWGVIKENVTENGLYKFFVRRPLGHEAKNNPDENGYTYIKSDHKISVTSCANTEPITPTPSVEVSEVTGLTESHTHDSITLSWTLPTGDNFSHINIYKNNAAAPIAKDVKATTFTDVNLTSDTEYTYILKSVGKDGRESEGVQIKVKTTKLEEDKTPPGDVEDLALDTKGNSAKGTISWKNPTDPDFSNVKVYLVNSDSSVVQLIEGTTDLTSYSLDEYKGKISTFKVTTIDRSGNESPGKTILVDLLK